MRSIGGLDDRILGEEAGSADQRAGDADAGDRYRADHHQPEGPRDMGAQAAHVAHILRLTQTKI